MPGVADRMRCIITGGGTGGHLFPGISIALEIMRRSPENRILFIGTGRPFEISILAEAGFDHKQITVEGIKGRGLLKQVLSIMKMPIGLFEAMLIMKRFKPDLVIGMGSYSAGPVVLGAWFLGVKIVLHEQNILPGITNRMLACFANIVFLSFADTAACFKNKKILVTGNPLRKEILCGARDANKKSEPSVGIFTVLIIGGSQGAHAVNIAVIKAVLHIRNKEKYFFIHQTGNADEEIVRTAYYENNIACDVKAFFHNMAGLYSKADLVVSRAGATTVAEVTVTGKAAIFIPFPFAADNHQVLNAGTLVSAGAAEMILEKDLTGEGLAERIVYYALNPEALSIMASRAKNLGTPDAAQVIADQCFQLADQAEGML
jgi:UDP-N-acetylglucosamine--N-acetylmuramyl-(pentapeptide) pyrophosphoryl-undecaprenol N-acetylglucosamine transferase